MISILPTALNQPYCMVKNAVLLRLEILFVCWAGSNTARFLGIRIVDANCAVPTDILYCLQGSVVDYPAWEYIPHGPTDACSGRWAMRDFIPGLRTLEILGSGTPLTYGLPRNSTTRKILSYVTVSAPKPVVNIDIQAFETGIFDVSATIWWILGYQSLLLLVKQSKSQLQVGEDVPTHTVQTYLLTVINILAITMFPDVLRILGGARAFSYRMHVYFTRM